MATKIRVAAASQVADVRANDAQLKQRVKELESEVSSLKRRLDELRKAKNTTVVKREREIVEVGTPFGRRDSRASESEDRSLDKKVLESEIAWKHEKDEMKRKFEIELNKVKTSADEAKQTDCGHWKELEFLRHRNEELENDNSALVSQNRELKDKVDSLLSDLSVKEATWCEMEEKFKIELKRSWGEKYKEWMEATEAKIEELQRTNAMLRTYLKKQRPAGVDPTGQDPDLDLL